MQNDRNIIVDHYQALSPETKEAVNLAVDRIVAVKNKGGKIIVVTGSGPNLHEGVTTLIAELIDKNIIDGVTTSSAVVAHEMAGTLDLVKRVNGEEFGFGPAVLPKGSVFEVTVMPEELLVQLKREMLIDQDLIAGAMRTKGETIIKAAGNMAYPMGYRTEMLGKEIMLVARCNGQPFEYIAGAGADGYTMIGAAHRKEVPCLVTVPQLIGGGLIGICIADSISIAERTTRIAHLLDSADVIIESAVALTQEIHDGPFETYTGHGIWSHWQGTFTYSLADKTVIRIDLDPNLAKAWHFEREFGAVQKSIDVGLPKTKHMAIPFRMEMSGFARLDNSIPVVADIGVIWPILATQIEKKLGVKLDFMSYPQQTSCGQVMREWIVKNVKPMQRITVPAR